MDQMAKANPIVNVQEDDRVKGMHTGSMTEQEKDRNPAPDNKGHEEEEPIPTKDGNWKEEGDEEEEGEEEEEEEEEEGDDYGGWDQVNTIVISPLPTIPLALRPMPMLGAEREATGQPLGIDRPLLSTSDFPDGRNDLASEQGPPLPELPSEPLVHLHSSPTNPSSVAESRPAPPPPPPEFGGKKVRFESDKDISHPVIHEPRPPPRQVRKTVAEPAISPGKIKGQVSGTPRSVATRSPSSRPRRTTERRAPHKSPAPRSMETVNRVKACAEASFHARGRHLTESEMTQLLTGDFSGASWETPIDKDSPMLVGSNSRARGLVRTTMMEEEDDGFKEPNWYDEAIGGKGAGCNFAVIIA